MAGMGSLTGGFTGGAGSSYQGGSAKNGDQKNNNSLAVGGFSITAAPAWAGGVSNGGKATSTTPSALSGGISQETLLIGGAVAVVLWALMRKK